MQPTGAPRKDEKPQDKRQLQPSSGPPSNSLNAQIKGKKDMTKYFNAEKGPTCFNCKGWGHVAEVRPNKVYVTKMEDHLPAFTMEEQSTNNSA